MQNVTQVDSSGAHQSRIAMEGDQGGGVGLTLVVQPRGRTVMTPSAITLNLTGPAPRVVHSFQEACNVLLSESVSVVLLVDDPSAPFCESELDVIGKLAGRASIVLVQPWQALEARGQSRDALAAAAGMIADQPQQFAVGALRYNPVFGGFQVDSRLLKLSHAESRLLLDVISAPQHYISARDLVSGGGVTGEPRSEGVVRQFVYRIRRKLAAAGDPAFLVAVRSGYSLLPPGSSRDLHKGRSSRPLRASAPAPYGEAEAQP